jgi:hypothetical protein
VAALALAASRLTVQYGAFPIDETKGCILASEYDSHDTGVYGNFYIEFRVRLLNQTNDVAADDATFAALIADVETSLRIPRQRLLVKIGNSVARDWDFAPSGPDAQTAILIEPELKLLEDNCRDYKYGLHVRCQFPGNVPGNVFRRESLTQIGSSLRERRVCSITATWTSTTNVTAYERYLASGDAFFDAYLPANVTDQYGNDGQWVLADAGPSFNDENSLITATRTYWEVFDGRRDSNVLTVTRIDGRRVCTIPNTWTSTPGFTALENYTDNGNAFFNAALANVGNVSSGEWVLVDEEPSYNDQNAILTVVRVYHEVVNGLREYSVRVTQNEFGARQVVVTGMYYATALATAKQNYTSGIDALVTGAMTAEGITHYESHSVPKVTGYDTTGLRYFFTWTLTELAYPQGPSAWDDTNVLVEFLEVRALQPFDPQSMTAANPVTRLKTVIAKFVASIDMQSAGGNDPVGLWQTKFRAHVMTAVLTRLGSYVSSVEVVEEEVGAGLDRNQLIGTLRLVVTGGTLLWMRITQTLTLYPGRTFVGRADGTPFSFRDYRVSPQKRLHRDAEGEFVGPTSPTIFGAGDNVVSGFGLIDTGVSAQDSYDAQSSGAAFVLPTGNWFIDREADPPYRTSVVPMTRGDGGFPFETVGFKVVENWRYIEALEPSP